VAARAERELTAIESNCLSDSGPIRHNRHPSRTNKSSAFKA
jgi:hypothetical protein